MMTVLLYGFLGRKFGKVHKYDVKTPAEAVRAMSATLKNFSKEVIDGGSYKVIRGGKEFLTLENLKEPYSNKDTLRIVPVVEGAGGKIGAVLTVIVGALLIWFSMGMATGAVVAGMTATTMASAGWMLVISGVMSLLFAPPKANANTGINEMDAVENRPSYSFNGAVNTVAQGNPVPVCYGQLLVGSQIISAGLTVEQVA